MSAAPRVLLVDGSPVGRLDPMDRGLHFGDGLFETIACRRGRPRFLRLHLERLTSGCARLGFAAPDAALLRSEVGRLAADAERAIVKLIVTRGIAAGRGYAPSGTETPTRVLLRQPWPAEDPAWAREGVTVRLADLRLGENPLLAGLKHLNRLEQVLARAEWRDPGIAEALLFSSSGRLVSGTMSNVFLVQDSGLRTPRLDRCGIAGVMRRVVLRLAREQGIPVEECDLSAAELSAAGEVFLTNARIGIWPVRTLAGRPLTVGAVTRRLQERLQPLLEEPEDA